MNTHYKKAAVTSEVAGTLLNPLNTLSAVGGLGGAIAAKVTPTRTDDEQKEADKKGLSNLLFPGVAPYNLFKRYGHTHSKEKEKHHKNKLELLKAEKEKKAYVIGFVKRASEYGLTETQAIQLYKQSAEQAPYGGVKTLGEMWNEFKTKTPTMAPKQPVSKSPQFIDSRLAKKGSAADAPVANIQTPNIFSGALDKVKNMFGNAKPSLPPTPSAAPVRQFGMTHNALANAQNQLDSGGDLSIMGER